MEMSKTQSIASFSPSLAWSLLTEAEQQLIIDYLIKVLCQEETLEEELEYLVVAC